MFKKTKTAVHGAVNVSHSLSGTDTVLGCTDTGEFCTTDQTLLHTLVLGYPLSGKHPYWVTPFVEQLRNRGDNLIVLDPDGKLEEQFGASFYHVGYTLMGLNLCNPLQSPPWNIGEFFRNLDLEQLKRQTRVFSMVFAENTLSCSPIAVEACALLIQALMMLQCLSGEDLSLETIYQCVAAGDTAISRKFNSDYMNGSERACLVPYYAYLSKRVSASEFHLGMLANALNMMRDASIWNALHYGGNAVSPQALQSSKVVQFITYPTHDPKLMGLAAAVFHTAIYNICRWQGKTPNTCILIPDTGGIRYFHDMPGWMKEIRANELPVGVSFVFDGLPNIKTLFPDTWEQFLSEFEMVVGYGFNDSATADYMATCSAQAEPVKKTLFGKEQRSTKPFTAAELLRADVTDAFIILRDSGILRVKKFESQ